MFAAHCTACSAKVDTGFAIRTREIIERFSGHEKNGRRFDGELSEVLPRCT
jgi:hypothetical protein